MKKKFNLPQTGVFLCFSQKYSEAYSKLLNRSIYLHEYCQIVKAIYLGQGSFECTVTHSQLMYSEMDSFIIHKSQLRWYCTECSNTFIVINDDNPPICDDCAQSHL